MGLPWPLRVGSRELIPVDLDQAWTNKVHLAQRALRGEDAGRAVLGDPEKASVHEARGDRALDSGRAPVWRSRTLCGWQRGSMIADRSVDLLGEHRRLLCQSCWRTVEGWLSPPPAVAGEGDVVHWVVATVLEIGEALVEGVPAGIAPPPRPI